MRLHTASEVISFIGRLENEMAELYEQLGGSGKYQEALLGFARENRRNNVLVQQAYNNVISDAFEGGFAFDIEADDFKVLPVDKFPPEATEILISIEQTMQQLYSTAAEQSRSLLPDVSRVLSRIKTGRQERLERLKEQTSS